MKLEVLVQALDILAFVLVTPEIIGEKRLSEARAAVEKKISNIISENKEIYDSGKKLFDSGKEILATEKEKSLAQIIGESLRWYDDKINERIIEHIRLFVRWLTSYKSISIKDILIETLEKCKKIYTVAREITKDIKGLLGNITEYIAEYIVPKVIIFSASQLLLVSLWLAKLFAIRGRLFAIGCFSFFLARSIALWLAFQP